MVLLRSIRFRVLAIVALFALVTCTMHAQNLTGEIDGVVHDPSGAVVPNAVVTIRNTDTNLVERKIRSNGRGEFGAPQLAVGTYSVIVRSKGFRTTTVQDVEVHANQPISVSVTLKLGQATQHVTVVANPLAPQIQNAAASTLISGKQVRSLSLEDRNFEELLSLQPGVTGSTSGRGIISAGGQTNSADFSVDGQRADRNGYFLDGQDILNHGGSQQVAVTPSIAAIQELTLVRNSFGAQYGGEGSAIVTIVSRSGTDHYHGGAFYFLRSQVLDANDYFANLAGIPKPGLRYNDFGFDVGGPVWIPHLFSRKHPRTFFFVAGQYLREADSPQETLSNIPTAQQRQGIFDAPVCTQYSGSKCTASATSIPESSFDPEAQAYLKDVINKTPLPNSPIDPQGLITAVPGFENQTQTFIRIDHQFNSKLSVFFRYLDDPFHIDAPFGLYQGKGIPGVANTHITAGGTVYLAHATYVANANTVVTGGFGFMTNWITSSPYGLLAGSNSPDIHPVLPYASTVDSAPALNILGTNYTAAGHYVNPSDNLQAFVNVTYSHGIQTLYFGGNFENITAGNNQAKSNAGLFKFTGGNLPTGSTASKFDQTFADFLLGKVSSFSQSNIDPGQEVRGRLMEAYLEDDVKATPRLTLNAGVRYTFIQQPVSIGLPGFKKTQLTNFDPSRFSTANAATIDSKGLICTAAPCAGGATPNPNYDPLNGLIIAGSNSPYGDTINSQPKLNFAPRVGFALDVYGNGKLALRGGYGIYYAQTRLGNYDQVMQNNPPYVLNTTITNTSFDNPGSGAPTLSSEPLALQVIDPHQSLPYSEDYTLDVQNLLARGVLLDIGYYGSRSLHQEGTADINQPIPGAYVADGILPGDGITAGNTQALNQIRPYPGWGPINQLSERYDANYNSLQVRLTKRFVDGSLVNINYTWAKALTNSPNYSTSPENTYDIAAEYGPDPMNRKHVLTADFVYTLPFFRTEHGFKGKLLGGWETSGIITIQSGTYHSAGTVGVDPAGVGWLQAGLQGATMRPDVISDPNNNAPHNLKQWFDTSAFVEVPQGQYRVGNAPVGDIAGPGQQVWNLSLFKNFTLPEKAKMQFRAEAFNVFNHTNFTNIATTLGNHNYGQVTAAGNARVLQLALRLDF